jgi:hypothetical protein
MSCTKKRCLEDIIDEQDDAIEEQDKAPAQRSVAANVDALVNACSVYNALNKELMLSVLFEELPVVVVNSAIDIGVGAVTDAKLYALLNKHNVQKIVICDNVFVHNVDEFPKCVACVRFCTTLIPSPLPDTIKSIEVFDPVRTGYSTRLRGESSLCDDLAPTHLSKMTHWSQSGSQDMLLRMFSSCSLLPNLTSVRLVVDMITSHHNPHKPEDFASLWVSKLPKLCRDLKVEMVFVNPKLNHITKDRMKNLLYTPESLSFTLAANVEKE